MRVIGLIVALIAGQAAQAGCGPDPAPCAIDGGDYHAARPDAPDGSALVFIHGYNSSGEAMMRARGMVEAALERGYTVIAPSGQPMQSGDGRTWSFRPDRSGGRDDIAFLQAVRDDAVARFDLDPARMLLAGFSIGGSMTAYVACAVPGAFSAYAPVSGNFWRPYPESCAGPAPMFHTHGWRDGTVPLEGRVLRGGALRQGDVFAAMRIWRDTNGCPKLQADGFDTSGDFWRRRWSDCAAPLELALFDGGHEIPPGWTDMALDWFEGLTAPE
ncbi:alpha/beta hydrolase family esterase [Palleronia rufa]|uniref:alpha/beta hydrolase family esterase n=1 Tax=Palleronia rufa TaxID=1530186 RepID=UPI000567DEC7|nr:PHB depolymerase family esterase [Palleronia rufa]